MPISPKQRIFVEEYLLDKNGARAARAAGYSHKTAREAACELLAKPHIRELVNEGLKAQAESAEISAERLIRRISDFAFNKPSIKASDILKACEMLGKHFKLFTDVQEITGKDGGPQVVLTMPANGSEKTSEPAAEKEKEKEKADGA